MPNINKIKTAHKSTKNLLRTIAGIEAAQEALLPSLTGHFSFGVYELKNAIRTMDKAIASTTSEECAIEYPAAVPSDTFDELAIAA